MHYHIILTELCNSQCRYCYEKSMNENYNLKEIFDFDFSAPAKSNVSIKALKKFIEKDKDSVLIFYGGEPLLEIEKIKEIIDNINIPFRMQTNGKLLHELPAKYVNRIGKILVSIDGDKERTDFNRSKDTYDLVMKNIQLIKQNGYEGEIIARMCISPPNSDIYEQVISLINAGFSSIHWQLDAGFYKHDYNYEKFSKFVEDYNKSISKLIDYWIDEMKKGNVIRIYPFIAIIDSLLKNETTKLRCGAGHKGYAITTNGKIVTCPITNGIKNFEVGDINDNPMNLPKIEIEECKSCSYVNLCGGRCLYWRKAKLWSKEGDELICKTIKYLIDELKKQIPIIKQLIDNKIIFEKDFEYEKYFGPEIIP